jgi:WXG100 family type VII secretion target
VVVVASTGKFRVNLEALASSASHVAGQGEDLATAHLSSDNRIVAAQSGWVGSSALAMNAKTAAWLETSRRLVTNVGDHATDLNNDGLSFTEMDREHTETLQALHPAPEGPAGSV